MVGNMTPTAGSFSFIAWFRIFMSVTLCDQHKHPPNQTGRQDGTSMSVGNMRGTTTVALRETTVHQTRACEVRDLLDRLADKWSLLVVELLDHSTRRFSELRHAI